MFREIFLPLIDRFTFLNIFEYITFRAAYAAVTALLISFIFGPKLIRALKKRKAGQEIRDDGPQTHLVKSGTPTMGGILILFAVVISVLLWQDLGNYHTWLSLFSLIGFGAIGFSRSIALPAAAAASTTGVCRWCGVAIITASTSGLARRS